MDIKIQVENAVRELCDTAKLKKGDILVVGCSTSEVVGSKIGTNSDPDTAEKIFEGIIAATEPKGIYLAVQCYRCGKGSRSLWRICKCNPAEKGGGLSCNGCLSQLQKSLCA